MGIGKFIGAIFMGTVDVIDSVSAPFIEARDRVDAKEAQAKKREERKLQHTLEEEELRKDRQLRDLQIEQLLDEKAKKEAEPKKIPAKKKINRKSPQTLLRKKRVIDKKLKDGLITERTAVIQTNKAIAAEKMRLFIENQRKKKAKFNQALTDLDASSSSKEFDYVAKLKEIKYLKDAGEISQSEFTKLKKKIIDRA